MKKELVFEAVAMLDSDLIDDCISTSDELTSQKKPSRRTIKRAVAVAACLLLIIGLGTAMIPLLNSHNGPGDYADSGDFIYAVEFGDFLYEPISANFFAELPEIKALYKPEYFGDVDPYEITEEHLGEYLGVFPPMPAFGVHVEGKAYRFAAYPEYDSIIIVEQAGKYRFFASYGLAFSVVKAETDSTALFGYFGLPETFKGLYLDKFPKETASEEISDELFAVLCGKEEVDPLTVVRTEWEAWCKEHGDTRVTFDENGLSYHDQAAHQEYADFCSENTHSFFVSTNSGFHQLQIIVNTEFNYFSFQHNYYLLTEEESAAIERIIDEIIGQM